MPKNKDKIGTKGYILSSYGLRYKLKIILYLVSVLPFLICVYLVASYITPHINLTIDMVAALFLSGFIALVGFFVVKQVFERVLSLSEEAKQVASSELNLSITTVEEDEVGVLNESFSQLTQRLRKDIEELRSYSQKTTEINLEIQKHMSVLSNLLQISNLISEGAKLDEVIKTVTARLQLLSDSDTSYLFFREEDSESFYVKEAEGVNADELLNLRLKRMEDIFESFIKSKKAFIVDSNNSLRPNIAAIFYDKFKLKNSLAFPVYLKGKIIAILGMGNNRDSFTYKNDDIRIMDVFAKQLAMALENDLLVRSLKKLEVKDTLTGLYNETFIHARLEEEIKRAIIYRRPCAFILLNIDNFQRFQNDFGLLQAEGILKRIALLIQQSFTEIDRVARVKDNEFAIVLPEKNKRLAYQTAQEVRKKIELAFSKERDVNKKITVSGGVSENPLDGVSAEELILKAREALSFAKKHGKNRVCILPQEQCQ